MHYAVMQITRQTDATRANAIMNDPSVYPWVSGDPDHNAIDLTALVYDTRNVVLCAEHGAMVFAQLQPGYYEFHSAVLPEGRGDWALEAARGAFDYIFTHTDALEIFTRCPANNPFAALAARGVGCRMLYDTRAQWPTEDGKAVKMTVYSMTMHQWALLSRTLVAQGEEFHAKMEEEFGRLDFQVDHPNFHDEHDRFVGAAVAMARGSQFAKGAGFYNLWAALNGYSPIFITKTNPIEFSIDGIVMRFTNETVEVISCP